MFLKQLFRIKFYKRLVVQLLTLQCLPIRCLQIGQPQKCKCGIGTPATSRVVKNTEAKPHEFPWQIGLTTIISSKPYCGGTLISDRFVVTAAHCVHDKPLWAINTLIGGHNWKSYKWETSAIKILAENVYIHPYFDMHSYFNDIALIKLRSPVNFSTTRQPPCFPRPTMNFDGQNAVAIGWGRTTEGGNGTDILHKIELPVISLKTCRKAFGKNVVASTMICASLTAGGKDACEGDSGGPLMWKKNGRWYLIGIVSWGYGCARPRYPGVYTRFDKYYSWVYNVAVNTKFCTN